ncbi:dipeptidase [Acidisphaera sp. L21]|uniref:dipeptidase n=1 Tax=Acidisphaera sp. L21 TaxID=1641851 RepID=UPI00131C1665|nr:dipeptidase [Acidisphaera sp. L21]
MTAKLTAVLDHIEAGLDGTRDRWFDLLRIPSVSAQPNHKGDCAAAAEWLRAELAAIGFEAKLVTTPGHPVVLAHHSGTAPGPRLLYYGHYDVQPAEPLELWTSPPFEPVLSEGPRGPRISARGAVDDKGQVMMWLEALRGWHAVAGGPPCPVTVLIEGEEEVGSVNLEPFLAAHRDALAADIAIISDTGMWDIDTPAVTTRLRGLVYTELTLHAAERDLHSGLYGGSALNPINALTRILGDLHDASGRIQLPGFYDGIADTSPAQMAEWAALGFDEGAFLGDIGLSKPIGEQGRSPLERMWARPTADINGIWGGYAGAGSKTVIAAQASAKVSFRLVPGQDPARVYESFKRFVADRTPADARVEFQLFGTAPGIEIPTDSPWVQAARAALADEYGRPAVLMGSGGSIPVVESMRRLLGVDSLLMGFGLADDQVHSPNEKFEWRCFHQGLRSHARLLAKLAAP